MIQTQYDVIDELLGDFDLRNTKEEVNERLKLGWQIIGVTENCSRTSGFTRLRVHLVKCEEFK